MMNWLNSLDPQVLKWALIVAVVLAVCLLAGLISDLRNRYPPRRDTLPHVAPFKQDVPKPVTGPQAFAHVNMLSKNGHKFDPAHCPECARLELRLGEQKTYPGMIRK